MDGVHVTEHLVRDQRSFRNRLAGSTTTCSRSPVAGVGARRREPPPRRRRAVRSRLLRSRRAVGSSTPSPRARRCRSRSSGSSCSRRSSHLVAVAVPLRVALVVAVPAVRVGLDDAPDLHRRGPTDDPRPSRRRPPARRCRRPRGERDAVAGRPLAERRRVLPVRGRELRVPVVLAEEDTGSRQTAARLTASWNAPWATAPSPKKATATDPSAPIVGGSAAPAAIGSPAATMPLAPKIPSVGSAMCIDPPRPRLLPLCAAHQLGEHRARVEALGEAVGVTAVSGGDHVVRRQRPSMRPTAVASWPIERWTKPGISPAAYSLETRSSKCRINSIVRSIPSRGSMACSSAPVQRVEAVVSPCLRGRHAAVLIGVLYQPVETTANGDS